jgi:pimeloyl-ACP methyl ester carboxylesterase
MPFVEVNDARIRYEEKGDGKPLVLAHGGWTGLEAWGANIDELSRYYRVIAYDRRDCGQSKAPVESSSAETWVEDLRQLMLALGVERGYVGGLSYGALITIELCLACPEMVEAAILASGSARGIRPSGRPGIVPFPDRRADLGKIKAPTLVLQGDLDTMFPAAHGEELHAGIPASEFVLVPLAGHSLQLDQSDMFNDKVIDFLKRVEKGQ